LAEYLVERENEAQAAHDPVSAVPDLAEKEP
jgi:hypothetical protein